MEQKVRRRVAQVQKDMILREQVKVLQHELGDDGDEELEEYAARIQAADLPDEIHTKLTKEVERLGKQPFGRPERYWTRTTTAWIRSSSAFWSLSPCGS